MREIKFRARRADTNEWVYGYYAKYGNKRSGFVYKIITNDGIFYDIRPSTVGQFTGLKDIEKKEVHEGDGAYETFISEGHENDVFKGVVEWFDSGWFVKTKEHGHISLTDCSIAIEIFGNIHENPELLKEDA